MVRNSPLCPSLNILFGNGLICNNAGNSIHERVAKLTGDTQYIDEERQLIVIQQDTISITFEEQ
jgi:hypothetical protein